jgi:hypothetical protein
MLKSFYIIVATILCSSASYAQWPGVYIEPLSITGMPALHSYVYGTYNGKWLLIGGRTDGLHRRQASSAFADAGSNKNIYVVDPAANMVWTAPLSTLTAPLREQLSATNIQFHQKDTTLYCVGGYGYSGTALNHITYPYLTAVNVPGLMNAVITGGAINGYFRQISNDWFAVTGGHLDMIYDLFYLVGGNKFTGRYNPMGGPSYTQEYTNQIRKMKIVDDGTSLTFIPTDTVTDVPNLHRRDYNLVPQIMPDGKEGLTAFSGVFQPTADVPYLSCVNIDSNAHALQPSFMQYYNHYHGANLPVYNSSANEMHTFFLGGIAQYYDVAGTLVADNNVPFVKTIARVLRSADGTMAEYKLPNDMPGLLGASAEIILSETVPVYPNHVVDYGSLTADTTLAGYLVGGILSTAPNIFTVNTGTESIASAMVYKVYLTRNSSLSTNHKNIQSNSNLNFQVYPNPNNGILFISFSLGYEQDVLLTITDETGRCIKRTPYTLLPQGTHTLKVALDMQRISGLLTVTIVTNEQNTSQMVEVR